MKVWVLLLVAERCGGHWCFQGGLMINQFTGLKFFSIFDSAKGKIACSLTILNSSLFSLNLASCKSTNKTNWNYFQTWTHAPKLIELCTKVQSITQNYWNISLSCIFRFLKKKAKGPCASFFTILNLTIQKVLWLVNEKVNG